MTQEQRLEEAKVTEQENLASLNEFLARELDKKRTTRKATQLYAPDGPPGCLLTMPFSRHVGRPEFAFSTGQ